MPSEGYQPSSDEIKNAESMLSEQQAKESRIGIDGNTRLSGERAGLSKEEIDEAISSFRAERRQEAAPNYTSELSRFSFTLNRQKVEVVYSETSNSMNGWIYVVDGVQLAGAELSNFMDKYYYFVQALDEAFVYGDLSEARVNKERADFLEQKGNSQK